MEVATDAVQGLGAYCVMNEYPVAKKMWDPKGQLDILLAQARSMVLSLAEFCKESMNYRFTQVVIGVASDHAIKRVRNVRREWKWPLEHYQNCVFSI